MLKQLSICAAFVLFGASSSHAQQDNGTLQDLQGQSLTRIEVPGANFDIVVSTTKSQVSATIKSDGQVDPLDVGLWPTQIYLVPKARKADSALE